MHRRKPSFTSLFENNAPGEQADSEYNQVVTKVEHARQELEQAERALEHEIERYTQHLEQYDRNIREAYKSWELAGERAMQQQEQDMMLAVQQHWETQERCQQTWELLQEQFRLVMRRTMEQNHQQNPMAQDQQIRQEAARYQQIRQDLETDQARAEQDLEQAVKQVRDRLRQALVQAQDDLAQAEEQARQGQQQAYRSVEQAQDRTASPGGVPQQAQRAQQDLQQGLRGPGL